MPTPFFDFGPFDREIAKKLESLETPPEALMALLEKHLAFLGSGDHDRVRQLWAVLSELSFDHLYANYLTHPIRVAASYAADRASLGYDDVALCLCHNVIEAGLLETVRPLLSSEVTRSIELLTIDRSREGDPDYLAAYYSRIERAPGRLALVKALDKLDNTLSWVRFDVDASHATVVVDFLCPRVEAIHPRLAGYLRGLTRYVRSDVARERFALAR